MAEDDKFYAISGIPLDEGQTLPYRLDIDEWYNDPANTKQVYLFITALKKFQDMDYHEKLSYFRIAGIHGYPQAADWDGSSHTNNQFFCAHNLSTFLTWHRVYVTLYERQIYDIMIASIPTDDEIPANEKDDYINAAKTWRLPYWDYAKYPKMATIAATEILQLEYPNGQKRPFQNPMWQYKFSETMTMGDPSLGKYAITTIKDNNGNIVLEPNLCTGTSRYIDPDTDVDAWRNGQSNNLGVDAALPVAAMLQNAGDKPGATIRDVVLRLTAKVTQDFDTWRHFATTRYNDKKRTQPHWMSLEQFHNMMHITIGGYTNLTGHMSFIPVAAFDPIFWVHHCFIDRVFAIWQTVHDDKYWFDDSTEDPGDRLSTSDLIPFHKDEEGRFYNSNDTRDWRVFNYNYENLISDPDRPLGLVGDDSDAENDRLRSRIYERINQDYGDTRALLRDAEPTSGMIGGGLVQSLDAHGNQIAWNQNDYVINVIYDRNGYRDGVPYIIYFFVGDLEEGVSLGEQPNGVGMVANFSAPFGPGTGRECTSCQNDAAAGVLSRAQVPITAALYQKLNAAIDELDNFDRDTIAAYLAKHLKCKIADFQGNEIPRESLEPNLKVVVYGGKAEHPSEDALPSQFESYKDIYILPRAGSSGPSSSIAEEYSSFFPISSSEN